MKLNATSEMEALTQHSWGSVHPFQPVDSVQGYRFIIEVLPHPVFRNYRNFLPILKPLLDWTRSHYSPTLEHKVSLLDYA